MTFLPLSECCLQGSILTGTPRGELQTPNGKDVHVTRYVTRPAEGPVADEKAALVVLYDVFGFSIPNAKILADRFADRLKIDVYVPDYIPNPPPAELMDPAIDLYPDQRKDESWFTWGKSILRLLPHVPFVLPGVLDGRAVPLVDKALDDLVAQGYTKIVAVGYCRGGSMVAHLLSKGGASPLAAGVIFHPAREAERYPKFTRPSMWIFSEVDRYFPPKKIEELKKVFAHSHAEFSYTWYKDTKHGFGARPHMDHEPSKLAFNDSHDKAIAFLEKQLGRTG